jgi:hypothetical protein
MNFVSGAVRDRAKPLCANSHANAHHSDWFVVLYIYVFMFPVSCSAGADAKRDPGDPRSQTRAEKEEREASMVPHIVDLPLQAAWKGESKGSVKVLFPNKGSLLDHGSVNCLDPEPCYSDWDIFSMCGKKGGKGLKPDPARPLFRPVIISRDSASKETAWEWVASPHSGCAAAGSEHQQNEHVTLNYLCWVTVLKSLC